LFIFKDRHETLFCRHANKKVLLDGAVDAELGGVVKENVYILNGMYSMSSRFQNFMVNFQDFLQTRGDV
jgi:hypothetical protein